MSPTHLGAFERNLRIWAHLGAFGAFGAVGRNRRIWAHSAHSAHLGAISAFGRSWAHLGAFGAVGRIWSHLGAFGWLAPLAFGFAGIFCRNIGHAYNFNFKVMAA